MNDKFYYHATDLFAVGEILRTGLKAGEDARIWLYNDIDATFGVCAMLDAKKMMNTEESLSDWRSFLYCGYAVFQIDASTIHSAIIKDRYGYEELFAVEQNVILPTAIKYIGCYNFRSKQIKPMNYDRVDAVYLREIKPREEARLLVDSWTANYIQNALIHAKSLSKVEQNRNEQHRT